MIIAKIGKDGRSWVGGHNVACDFNKKTINGSKRCSAVAGQGFRHQVQRIGNTDKFRVMDAPEQFAHRIGQELAMVNAPAQTFVASKSDSVSRMHSLGQGGSTWVMRSDVDTAKKLIKRNAEQRSKGDIMIQRTRAGFIVTVAPGDLKWLTETKAAPKPQRGRVYKHVFRLTAGANK